MALAAQIAVLGGQIAALDTKITAFDKKLTKVMNSSALLGIHALEEIAGPGNVLPSAAVPPVWFPSTRTELETLTGPRGETRSKDPHVVESPRALSPPKTQTQQLHCTPFMLCKPQCPMLWLHDVQQSHNTSEFDVLCR